MTTAAVAIPPITQTTAPPKIGGGAGVVTFTIKLADAVSELPALSVALTATVCAPFVSPVKS